MRHRRPPRLPVFDYYGCHRYFVTMCTIKRQHLFVDPVLVARVRWQILRTSADREFAVLAYTFMPDHIHLLVEGTAEACDFRRFMSVLRRRTTIACEDLNGLLLWQDGFHERVIRDSDDLETTIDYILNNPVRAGLVGNATDHPFSYSVTLEDHRGGLQTRPPYVRPTED